MLLRPRHRGATLKLAIRFALFLVFAMAAQSHAEEYYIYQTPNGGLVISNKEPPPGSKIIKQLPGTIDSQAPQDQDPAKTQPNGKTDSTVKPSTNK